MTPVIPVCTFGLTHEPFKWIWKRAQRSCEGVARRGPARQAGRRGGCRAALATRSEACRPPPRANRRRRCAARPGAGKHAVRSASSLYGRSPDNGPQHPLHAATDLSGLEAR